MPHTDWFTSGLEKVILPSRKFILPWKDCANEIFKKTKSQCAVLWRRRTLPEWVLAAKLPSGSSVKKWKQISIFVQSRKFSRTDRATKDSHSVNKSLIFGSSRRTEQLDNKDVNVCVRNIPRKHQGGASSFTGSAINKNEAWSVMILVSYWRGSTFKRSNCGYILKYFWYARDFRIK
jgi:hypothetical protein